MKKLKLNKRFILGSALLMVGSLLALGCNKVAPDPDPEPIDFIIPNYLVNGTYSTSNDKFDFYEIEGRPTEYAIAIKDKNRTGSVEIPTTYNGHNVTAIWHNGFHNSKVTSVTFRDDTKINTIDFEAFLYCKITSINIPYTVNEIGDAAFYACSALTSVNFINSNQESTGSALSCDCDDQISRYENLAAFPLEGDPDVTYVALDTGKQYRWDTTNSQYVEIVIENSTLEKIPSFCFFKCNALTTLALPSSIEEVAEEAFNGCYSLSSAIFFSSIKTIRERAFQGCTALTKVYVSQSMFDDLNTDDEGIIEPHAFNYCSNILDVIFCGTSEKVSAWLVKHPNWGWNSDYGNPATDKYDYTLESGSTYFTSEWQFTAQTIDGVQHVTITKYTGSAPTQASGRFISVPNSLTSLNGTNKVVKIDKDAFNDVKSSIYRLYLPTTLMQIENNMFKEGYTNLNVIADNTQCAEDLAKYVAAGNKDTTNIVKRIDLSELGDLEFIGVHAFAYKDKGLKKATDITQIKLPANLRAIGDEAFGVFQRRVFTNVTEFTWDFNESTSRLETIGTDCFYGLGASGGSTQITGNVTWKKHKASTLIFPKTFKYFGMKDSDARTYRDQTLNPFRFAILDGERAEKWQRPAHAFAGCSLIGTVIFKGGTSSDPKVQDLLIPLQTFVYNESLHTIVFEEREEHYITFHTQQQQNGGFDYAQEAIGGNAGRGKNDFRSEPFLHTLVLPNMNTKLRFQTFAFRGNSRAAIYFSGSENTNLLSDKTNGEWTKINSFEADNTDLTRCPQWKTIGDESWYEAGQNDGKKYHGYCFADNAKSKDTSNSKNTFNINQEIPCYYNVHFQGTFNGVNVEVGTSGAGRKEYKEVDKCSYVLEEPSSGVYEATMTNYLYNLHNESDEAATGVDVARVVDKISFNGHDYIVKKVGDSAFSACFNDGTDGFTANGDLTKVELPDSIVTIGEYAFIRAYGIQNIASYTEGNAAATDYKMPKDLRHIGKNAFLFSGVQKIEKIDYRCLFYENENETYDITSVFANALSLRKITFTTDGGATETTSTDYYETTTYTPSGGGDTYTTAVYSKSGVSYNKDRLLVVLNRSNGDYAKPSSDATAVDVGVRFNGKYKTNPFLFGAFKMGVWIKELIAGNPTLDSSSNVLPQPLFSPVGKTVSNQLVDQYFYLGGGASSGSDNLPQNLYYNNLKYENLTNNLDTIAGNVLHLPEYALKGCENLAYVEFPVDPGASIPEGIFADVENPDTVYYVAGDTPVAHTLDLTNSGYSSIGPNVFSGNLSIHTFIAPDVSGFTIDASAFKGCTNLSTLDFSEVQGSLTINAGAFMNTGVTTIDWPDDPDCTITIGGGDSNGAFQHCALVNLELPAKLQTIGVCAFMNCQSLESVSSENSANIPSVTTFNTKAFAQCGKLDSFCFDKFTGLTTIGTQAFQDTGKLESFGNVSLPSSVTSIGKLAFNASKIVTVTINSSSISLGESAFYSCASLTHVWFTNPACNWNGYNANVFSNCSSLVELQLPTGFALNTNKYDGGSTYFVQDDSNLVFYTYKKYVSGSTAVKDGWQKYTSGVYCPLCFLVENENDLLTGGVIIGGGGVSNNTTKFWAKDASGHSVYLGTVTAYDGTTVTFSTGYTLDGSTFTPSL